jgi:hypothetical protein
VELFGDIGLQQRRVLIEDGLEWGESNGYCVMPWRFVML